ncbi:MAG: DUF721 domain-containing protein [Treponema sp.]|jgi:hypothetical protein|nr:DUF721 domain-containing protein [Treponema sp.]
MKKAGDLLSFFFDEKMLATAQGYAKVFTSWDSIVKVHKIPAALAHSRIVELERHVILIEADHPGWIQILQTKQREFLQEFQRRFPDFAITGISFRLSRNPLFAPGGSPIEKVETAGQELEAIPDEPVNLEEAEGEESKISPYAKIHDSDFRETLKRLEKRIILRNKEIKKKNP